MKKIFYSAVILAIMVSVSSAAQVNFSANVANNVAGVGGADLAVGDLVEIGILDTGTLTFTSFFSGANDNQGFGAGFFSHSTKLDTTSLFGEQLAYRWTEAASGLTALAYYDITVGSNPTLVSQWTLKAGDGTALDTNINSLDISNLTDGVTFNTLDPAAVLINAEFSGSNVAGVPSFNVVPEPSSFALLAGCFGLAWVMVRRRA